jgi:serine/threonine protein kinase
VNVGDVVGNYRITRVLGEGGMGVVYLGTHNLIGREAAIKVLLPSLSNKQEVVQRFFNEAKTTTSIKHPGIVEIFDFGYSDQGHAFIVMEHLEGETLDARIQRLGSMPAVAALPMLAQIARAVGAAHELGVVHRDLKPENIYIVADPEVTGGERTKILDFGIAKLRNAGNARVRTASGQVMGPPGYIAPEQCLGAAEVDPRADIYALGCILFDMLCGRPPFESPNFADVLAAHVSKEPPAPSSLVSSVSKVVDGLVAEMLQKAPEQRPQTVAGVLERIDAVMKQLAKGPARPARASKPPPIPAAKKANPDDDGVAPHLLDSRAPLPPLPRAKKKSLPPPVPRAAASARTMYESDEPAAPPSPPSRPAMRPMPVAPPTTTPGQGPVNPLGATMAAPSLSRPEPQPQHQAQPQPGPPQGLTDRQRLAATQMAMQPQAQPQPQPQPQRPPPQPHPVTQPPMGQPPMGQPPMGQPPMGQPPMGQPPMGQPPMGQPPMGAGPHGTFALAPANQMEPMSPAQPQPGPPAVAFSDPLRPMRPVQPQNQPRANPAQYVDPRAPRAIAEPPRSEGSGLLLPFLLVLLVGGLAGGFFLYRSMTADDGSAGDVDAAAAVAANDKNEGGADAAATTRADAAAIEPPAPDAAPVATADAAPVPQAADAAPSPTPAADAAPSKPPIVEPGSGRVIDPALGSASGVPTVTLKIASRPSGARVVRKYDNLELGKTPLEYVTKKFNANEELVVELAGHYPVEVKISTNRDGARQVLLLKKR